MLTSSLRPSGFDELGLRRALADPARLAAMAAAAHAHVLAHHTEEALLSHVIAATMAEPPRG